jgi:hypothetical protein
LAAGPLSLHSDCQSADSDSVDDDSSLPTVWRDEGTAEQREVLARQRLENDSFQNRDLATYERITSRDYLRVDYDGRVGTRAETMAMVTAVGANPRIEPNHSDHRVRVLGDLAVVAYLNTASVQFRVTAVFVKEDAAWKQRLRQLTLISAD